MVFIGILAVLKHRIALVYFILTSFDLTCSFSKAYALSSSEDQTGDAFLIKPKQAPKIKHYPLSWSGGRNFLQDSRGAKHFADAMALQLDKDELELKLIEHKFLAGSQIKRMKLYFEQTPLCRYYVKEHTFKDGQQYIIAQLPKKPLSGFSGSFEEFWPREQDFLNRLKEELIKNSTAEETQIRILSAEKCLYLEEENETLKPVFEFLVKASNEKVYRGYADAFDIYEIEPMFFEAIGHITAYAKNVKDGVLATEDFVLKDTAYLDSDFFKTDSSTIPRLKSDTFTFNEQPSSQSFSEQNVFFHASKMMNWFISYGFQFTGNPIIIQLHQNINGSSNNALYVPTSSPSLYPRILIGDGDGQILQNLSLDGDVVSHETGHHIVFTYLKSTSQSESETAAPGSYVNHSLAIHEGMADFFTFARTSDSCLGEAICPDNPQTNICYKPAACLRSAESGVLYKSAEYWSFGSSAHKKGQVVSNLLWALRTGGVMTQEENHKLTVASVNYLPLEATYEDLIVALLAADKALFAEKYHCHILSIAKDKNFTDEVASIGQEKCGGPASTKTGSTSTSTGSTSTTQPATEPSTSTSKKKSLCGVAAFYADNNTDDNDHFQGGEGVYSVWMLYLLALIFPMIRLAQRALARVKYLAFLSGQ